MGCFHGPNTFLEPIEQRKIISSPAKKSLAQVNMGLNESGQNSTAGSVNNRIGLEAGFAYARYASVANQQISANDGVVPIHRHQRSAFDKN
jgi:hypothetical protein